jgi:HEAT repeat protein
MRTPAAPALRRAPTHVLALLLAACASSAKPYHPGALGPEQAAKCRAAEDAYRKNAPEYPQLRDELVKDPVAASWLVRMFVRDLFAVREGRPLGTDEDLLRAAARIENPVEKRALAEILTLGAVAVPTVVGDLLLHDQPQPRELGIELLGRIGQPALPALREVVRADEPKHRRAAARALAAIGANDDALVELSRLTKDGDYTVRADAVRGLRRGNAAAGEVVRQVLTGDADPFVRRVAAGALAGHADPQSAVALIDYLERCKRDVDAQGAQVAQESLQAISGSRGPRTVEAWRAWAAKLPAPAAKH